MVKWFLAVVMALFVTTACAFADEIGEGGSVPLIYGASDISVDEAKQAFSIANGIDMEQIDEALIFTLDEDTKTVIVNYAVEGEWTVVDIIYYGEDGNLYGSGWRVTSSDMIEYFVGDVAAAVGGIYGIAAEGFDFVVVNPMGVLMVGLSFAGAGIGLVGRGFKTARK